MRIRPALSLIGLVTILIATGCPSRSNPAPAAATPAQVSAYVALHPASSAERIEHGRQLVITNCNHCHGYPTAHEVPAQEWAAVALRMCKKTDIEVVHYDQVIEYFQAVGAL